MGGAAPKSPKVPTREYKRELCGAMQCAACKDRGRVASVRRPVFITRGFVRACRRRRAEWARAGGGGWDRQIDRVKETDTEAKGQGQRHKDRGADGPRDRHRHRHRDRETIMRLGTERQRPRCRDTGTGTQRD